MQTTSEVRRAVPTQREVLRDVMLTAGKCGAWLTLREIARMTRYGEASISAQLRNLRKEAYGGFVLRKRLRDGEAGSVNEKAVVWEYRLKRGVARRKAGSDSSRTPISAGAAAQQQGAAC